ncbi:MAG: discoidin domain-containing protein [Deltaproteobacteria bacterium]|nr:discoidin domain-containing protein [Deltaproteobacteria bacterium]
MNIWGWTGRLVFWGGAFAAFGGCGEPEALFVVPPSQATLVDGQGAEYLAYEVIIELGPNADEPGLKAAVAELGGTIVDQDSPFSQELGFRRVLLPESLTADQAISDLSRRGLVRGVARNYLVHVGRVPNDARYGELWGLAKIGAPAAWDRTIGDRSMIVAVVDTGIDLAHPELSSNGWLNTQEVGSNGLDDDGNGYVDDVAGWDFYSNDNGPADDNGHGTHVAGTIGASGDNGQGVAGVNWRVQLQALKVLGANGSGSLWGAAQAIHYAARNGAKVVNASFGCQGCNVSYMQQAIVALNDAGGLFVAAAGNNGSNNDSLPFYPAAYTEAAVIAVAATNPSDTLASFSNYGVTSVDLAAPGTSILSTQPNNGYASFDGTSMAAPHVAGAVALFWSAHPNATAPEVKARLYATVAARSTLAGKVGTGGRLDVQALVNTDVEPPAAPASLVVEAAARRSAKLRWTAGVEADLALHRVFYGTAPGQPTQQVDVAMPTAEVTITGLTHGLTYFFTAKAMDRQGNLSGPSNEVSLLIQDQLPPPTVLDLRAESLPGVVVSGGVTIASGEYSEDYRAEQAYDGSPDTSWATPGRAVAQEEHLVVQLDQPTEIERLDLLASPVHAEFFPVDYDVEISADGSAWVPVGGERGASVPSGWATLNFPPVLASHLRLRILRSYQHPSGLYYAGLAELRIRARAASPDALWVHFTAPGDDPGVGSAASYDLRRSTSPITVSNYEAAIVVPGATPLSSGLPVQHLITGLSPETTYYFALKSKDAPGNVSGMSNVAVASTLVVPPSAIRDLSVVSAGDHAVTLAFTAPGSDGSVGRANAYELRYATTPIDAGNFNAATLAPSPVPLPAGAAETLTVSGLEAGLYYYFAVAAQDAGGHRGGISNVVSAATTTGPDLTPPAQITDLAVYSALANRKLTPQIHGSSSARASGEANRLLDNDPASAWRSNDGAELSPEWVSLDLGAIEPVVRVRLRASTVGWQTAEFPRDFDVELSVDAVNWARAVVVQGQTGAAGTWEEWSMPVTYARYLRLSIKKRGLGGCAAGVPSCARAVAIGELEAYGLTPALEAELAFSAPGDDGFLGTAQSYDLRTSAQPIDNNNFGSSTAIPLPAPMSGGQLELHRLPPLTAESRQYFALQAVDEAGNRGALSNVVSLVTPGIPPAPVIDLSANVIGPTSVTLSFTATGDDGILGQATAYELRYSTQPITLTSWPNDLAVVGLAPPQPSRSVESRTITGLSPDTEYYVALKVVDDLGQASLLSNLLRFRTLDGVAPARTTDLLAEVVAPANSSPSGAILTQVSGAYSFETEASNLFDGDATTVWLSPARSTPVEEVLELTLPAAQALARVRLRSAPAYTDLFPRAFRFEVKASANAPWTPVFSEADFQTAGGWEEWAIGAVPAVAARLVITETNVWVGSHYAALGELDLQATTGDSGQVRLSWTAPGDDQNQGTAARYELRRSTTALTDQNFGAGTLLAGAPTPSPAGSLERMTATGLPPATTQCFGLKTGDDAQNTSPVSTSPCVTLPALPPSVIGDLSVAQTGSTFLTLAWTAPFGMGTSGTATRYELRVSGTRITFDNWDQATVVPSLPAPAAPGVRQSHTLNGLLGQTRYFFGIKAINTAGQTSALSNVVEGHTLDNVAPNEVNDLLALTDSTGTGRLLLFWTAPGDGETGTLASYELRASLAPITPSNFSQGRLLTSTAPKAPGQPESLTVSGLDPEVVYYVALKTRDAAGNLSDLSNVASAATRDEAPARVNDLVVIGGAGQTSVTLGFTAPGDDGAIGTVAAYDLRYSTNYLSAVNFDSATPVPNAPTPVSSGAPVTVVVSGLVPGTTYYFAMKARDERGNTSAMSNWVSTQTADTNPPSAIVDLSATTGSAPGRVNLSWTAPGDDGVNGLAQSYELRWSLATITGANFASATLANPQPIPLSGGSAQTFVVFGLPNETQVYLAIKAKDDANNWAPISNLVAGRTPDVAPGRISNLAQSGRTGTSLTVTWTATGDDGTTGQASTQELRYSTLPITEANFAQAILSPLAAPLTAGNNEQRVISGLSSDTTFYLALIVRDERGNSSPLSNVLVAATADTRAPASITDLSGNTASSNGTVNLAFTAPGDDGTTGTAARYDLRYHPSPITSANWSVATPIVTTPVPRSAGGRESFQVGGLPGETNLHFAVRAIDEAGNEGSLAPSVMIGTRPIPPSRVTNLSAAPGGRSVTLTWTAPGDDGTVGRATRYELRYGTNLLTSINFDQATEVTVVPVPANAGTTESLVVNGLAEATTYYFGLVTIDDVGAVGQLSNIPSATTPDQTAPAAPEALVVVAPPASSTPLVASLISASSDLGANWRAAAASDGNLATSWSSASRPNFATETLTADLGSTWRVDRIRLHPDHVYPELFPRNFNLELSSDGSTWSLVARESDFLVTEAGWLEWGFEAKNARYARVVTTQSATSYGAHYAIIAELEILPAAPPDGRAQLAWIAPGDDQSSGTATSYEVYRKSSSFDAATLASATRINGAPGPAAAGSLQTMTVTSLAGERAYWWAIRAIDNEGNVGPLSPVVTALTNPVAPAPIADLAGAATGMTSVNLSFGAPGDDGRTGNATRYEVRYAAFTLTSRNWVLGTVHPQSITPRAPNGRESIEVSGLSAATLYRFVIVAYDEANTPSYLSNVAPVRTLDAADTVAPGAVADLDARVPTSSGQRLPVTARQWSAEQQPSFAATMVADQNLTTAWSAVSSAAGTGAFIRVELESTRLIDRVHLWPAPGFANLFPVDFTVRISPNGLTWTTVGTRVGYTAIEQTPLELNFAAAETRFVELNATRLASFGNGLYYAVVAELEPYEAASASGTALITWTAPGDDGTTGTASAYRLERSPCPFDANAAVQLPTEAPQAAGTPERTLVTGLAAGTHCLRLTTYDEANNVGPTSNLATITVGP